jgi:hypothetical protein
MNSRTDKRTPVRVSNLWRTDDGCSVTIISDADFRLRIFKLNPVGSKIWTLCDSRRTEEEIVLTLIATFAQCPPEDKIRSDTVAFLNHLRDEWLILWKCELEEEDLR